MNEKHKMVELNKKTNTKMTVKGTPRLRSKKKTAKILGNELTSLYQDVHDCFSSCESHLLKVKNLVESSSLIKPTTKRSILSKIQTIFNQANSIVNTLGTIGKLD